MLNWLSTQRKTIRSVGMMASANLIGTMLALFGSLVQAHFISPNDLGFVRKYSVVAGYAIFLSLGLFTIMQFEYPMLMGREEPERARRVVAIVQSWCLLAAAVVCGILSIVMLTELFRGRWREAAAWGIQVIAVWFALYGGYLTYAFLSGQEFERLARGQLISAVAGVAVVPAFLFWPFPTLVVRSVAGQVVSSIYLHLIRPVKVGWCLPRQEFVSLARRGLRLFVGNYLRYSFWLTVEIWLMLRIAGDGGVGLLTFGKLMAETPMQILMAINQVYIPRVARKFGESGSVAACLGLSRRPTVLSLGISVLIVAGVWFLLPPVIAYAFPKYAGAISLIRILVLQAFFVSVSLPIHMVTVLDGYLVQLAAALAGLGVFVGTAFLLQLRGLQANSVAWGTVAGQGAFTLVALLWVLSRARADCAARAPLL